MSRSAVRRLRPRRVSGDICAVENTQHMHAVRVLREALATVDATDDVRSVVVIIETTKRVELKATPQPDKYRMVGHLRYLEHELLR